MPITVDHPTKQDGKPSKAREVHVINKQKIGILLNTSCKDGKLKTQCWFDKQRLQTVEPKLYEKIKKGQKVEVSTGLRIDMEKSEGEWKGEKYIGKAKKFYPDHLAVLPNGVGACSVTDGAGIFANSAILPLVTNEASHQTIHQQICRLLRESYEEPGYIWMGYVEDIFDGYFVYSMDRELYRQDYKVANDVVSLVDEPQKVVRSVQYRIAADNEYIGNCTGLFISNAEKQQMTKQELVDGIVANSKGVWKDADKPVLLQFDETRLKELHTQAVQNTAPPVVPPVVPPPPPVVETQKIPNFGTTVTETPKEPTVQELLNNEALEEQRQALVEQKTAYYNLITENGKSTIYTKEELMAKKLPELRKLAALTGKEMTVPAAPVDYSGIGGGRPQVQNSGPAPRILGSSSVVTEPVGAGK